MWAGNFIMFTKVPLRDENLLDKDTNFIGVSFSCYGILSSDWEFQKIQPMVFAANLWFLIL